MTTYTLAELKRPLYSPDDIREASRRAGSHFFDAGSMRFFGSRILSDVFLAAGGGRSYFVTSERDSYPGGAWGSVRRYTVRVIAWDNPATIDEPAGGAGFGGYASRNGAIGAARRFAQADTGGAFAWPCPIELHAKYSEPLDYPDGDNVAECCRACLEDVTREARTTIAEVNAGGVADLVELARNRDAKYAR